MTPSIKSQPASKPKASKQALVPKPSQGKLTGWKLWVGLVLLLIGGLGLFMGQSAVWVSSTVFNQKMFVETTNNVLTTEESRNDIAALIVDRALDDRPVVKRLVSGQATALLSGLLGSDLVSNIYTRVANSAYAYITSPNQQDIAIDLTSIKTPLSGVVSFAENRGQTVQFDPSQIPDQIVLLDADDVPDLSGYIQAILVLNVLFWALAIITFAGYILLKKDGRVRRTYQVLAVISLVAVIGLLTGPFVPPMIASFVSIIQARDLVTALTSAYLAPFVAQMWTMLIIAGFIALALALRNQVKRGVVYTINSFDTTKTK